VRGRGTCPGPGARANGGSFAPGEPLLRAITRGTKMGRLAQKMGLAIHRTSGILGVGVCVCVRCQPQPERFHRIRRNATDPYAALDYRLGFKKPKEGEYMDDGEVFSRPPPSSRALC
jgi:hypothetical protein